MFIKSGSWGLATCIPVTQAQLPSVDDSAVGEEVRRRYVYVWPIGGPRAGRLAINVKGR